MGKAAWDLKEDRNTGFLKIKHLFVLPDIRIAGLDMERFALLPLSDLPEAQKNAIMKRMEISERDACQVVAAVKRKRRAQPAPAL